MSATAICEEQIQVRRERRPCGGLAGITLAQLLTRAHEGVALYGAADCPACGGHMERGGRDSAACGRCGTRLS